jgi:hypothetical protein
MKLSKILLIMSALCATLIPSGCCTTPTEIWRVTAGTSTESIERARRNALVKIFGYEYGTCYVKTEELVKKIPKLSVYSKNEGMIAVYYDDINITPVGLFFTEVDSNHTKVEVASPSRDAREYVAKSVFAQEVKEDKEKAVIEVQKPVAGKYH